MAIFVPVYCETLIRGASAVFEVFFFLSFCGGDGVTYNRVMYFDDQNKALRIFLYLLLFLISFLVFDSITVVATVFFAVVVLDYFLRKANQKESR
ncbi:MAG: hypothetical protein H8E42_01060 [Nitrospinae bacterium]|nr:hypothetical protein [Nitrospinota bacterium]MBL7021255.1 hypothetical protein [Nitrospinaceae bacterium]